MSGGGGRPAGAPGSGLLAGILVTLLIAAPSGGVTRCERTPENAEGPFYLPNAPHVERLDRPDEPGQRIELFGRVQALPDCRPVAGAVLDFWQANASGSYYNLERGSSPAEYRLRGRVRTMMDGSYGIMTVRPGSYGAGAAGARPAHIHVTVSAPGLETLTTQVYFPGDPHNAGDGLFDPSLLGTLQPRAGAPPRLVFDFVLSPARDAR